MANLLTQTPGREMIAGIEATGVVTEVGAGVAGFSPGTRVTFFPTKAHGAKSSMSRLRSRSRA